MDSLKISAISSTNQSFTFAPRTMKLEPIAFAYLVIAFTPRDTSDKSGFIILTHNADGSPDSIAVNGKGILTAINDETSLPIEYELSHNYPNPFNPATVISYQLPVASRASLKVYDLLGREVASLVNDVKPAGSYSVSWNARGMPSGVYFYRLQAGIFSATKKLLLLK
jgi:hypothetical protein